MVAVTLSCPPLNPTLCNWTYLYPFANTPLRDLCASSRGAGESLPTRALLLGCSDLSSVAHTLYLNQISKTCGADPEWKSTPIHALCCDIEPAIIARSLIYFEILNDAELSTKTMAVAWEMVYSVFVTPKCSRLLSKAIGNVLDRMSCGQDTGGALKLVGNRQAVVEILTWWKNLLVDECVGAVISNKVRDLRILWFKKTGVPLRGSTDDGRVSLWPDMIAARMLNGDDTFEKYVNAYREFGYAGVASVASEGEISEYSPSGNNCRTVINPTFFADVCHFTRALESVLSPGASAETIAKVWRVQVYMNPYMCIPGNLRKFFQETAFSKAQYIKAPKGKGVTPLQWAFELFGLRSAALVRALNSGVDHRIVLHCGDALALCDALLPEPRAWLSSGVPKVEELVRDLQKVEVPHDFDIIDTSNIADYSMALPLLIAAGPLLATEADNCRAVMATDLMSPKGEDYSDLFRQQLCEVPLWLIPFVCGLQVDFMHAEDSRDSLANRDPSRLWTAYPQSSVSITAAALSPGMFGATEVRWRRCRASSDKISLSQSPDLKAVIENLIGRSARSSRSSPCGITTCLSFLDMLATSGSLTDVKDLYVVLDDILRAGHAGPWESAFQALLPLHGLSTVPQAAFSELLLAPDRD